MQKQDRTV